MNASRTMQHRALDRSASPSLRGLVSFVRRASFRWCLRTSRCSPARASKISRPKRRRKRACKRSRTRSRSCSASPSSSSRSVSPPAPSAVRSTRTACLIAQIGGILVVVLGLHMMGMLRIPWLMMDARLHLRHDRRNVLDLRARRHGVRCRMVALHRPDSRRHSRDRIAAAQRRRPRCCSRSTASVSRYRFSRPPARSASCFRCCNRIKPSLRGDRVRRRGLPHRRRIGARQRCIPQRRRMVLSVCPATEPLA